MSKQVTKNQKNDKNKQEEPEQQVFEEKTGKSKFIYPNGAIYIGEYKQLTTGVKIREGKGKMINPLESSQIQPIKNSKPSTPDENKQINEEQNPAEGEQQNEQKEEKEQNNVNENEVEQNEEDLKIKKKKTLPKTTIDLSKPLPKGIEWYDGEWVNDQMEGYGVYHYSNGDIYEGNWKNNLHNGFGTYIFTDGHRYIGEWVNHKIHGKGKYLDMNNVGWAGEFRDGNYHSKDQSNLNEEKRIVDKIEEIKKCSVNFIDSWENTFASSDKKTIKDNLAPFFGNEENMGKYFKENYPKFEERTPDKWNDALKFVFNRMTGGKGGDVKGDMNINVPKTNEDLLFLNKEGMLTKQIQEDLSSGQVIEITTKLDNRTACLGLGYNKDLQKWLIIYFTDVTEKPGKK